jgi:hypothetical protein
MTGRLLEILPIAEELEAIRAAISARNIVELEDLARSMLLAYPFSSLIVLFSHFQCIVDDWRK